MQMNDMILVSVDDHVCEPPDMWERPPRREVEGPRAAARPQGRTAATSGCSRAQQIPNVGLNAVAGRRPEEYGMEPTALSQLRAGCYDVDARVGDMNANGVLGSLCFPTVPGFVGELFGRQAKAGNGELAIAMLRAYNDWHIDELVRRVPRPLHPARDPADLGPGADGRARCGASPGRAATPSRSPTTRAGSATRACTASTGIRSGRRAPTRARSSASTSARARGMNLAGPGRPDRGHDRGHADHALQLRHRARVLADLRQVPDAQDRALRGRHRLDPVLPRAHRLRARPPPPLDPARLPERQDAERRVPRAHHHLLHRRRGRRAQPRPDRRSTTSRGSATTRTPTRPGRRRPRRCGPRSTACPTTTSTRSPGSNTTRHFRTTPSSTSRRSSARSPRCAPRRRTST